MNENSLLLEVRNLKTYFFLREGIVRAVDGTNFEVQQGRTLGIIGESGCGKSVTALSILRIVPHPGRVVEGEVLFHRPPQGDGSDKVTQVVDLTVLDPAGDEIRSIRGKEIAMVFQEPMSSLTPVYTIGDQIMEAILLHQKVNRAEAREGAIEMLDRVGMPKPSQTVDSYPHQLSGGMRQRAMIAIALSCNPSLLIADEPTTALDVTTEAQILELMRDLQQELGMSIMYITHDLGVIAEIAEDVAVMYMGKIVERADVVSLFHDPLHPYTRALLKSIPKIGRKSRQRLVSIKGTVPDPFSLPEGCPFHPRCSEYMETICDRQEPKLLEVKKGHWVSCLHS
jgi:oligopeptide/dipeptide ABC transporter ATP-binding protein